MMQHMEAHLTYLFLLPDMYAETLPVRVSRPRPQTGFVAVIESEAG